MAEPTLVSVDLETGGTDLGAAPLIAIGACAVDRDWEAEWSRLPAVIEQAGAGGPFHEGALFYVELRPQPWNAWDEGSVQFHGLTRDHLAEKATHPLDALRALASWLAQLGPAPYRLVSHNAAFDWAHLQHCHHHYGIDDPFDPFPVCTKNLARGIFRHETDDLSGQTGLRARLGMKEHLGSHNALADALSQAVLYRRLLTVP